MAAVKLYIDKFGKDVIIDETHPLAIAQRARDASTPPKTSESTEEKLPKLADLEKHLAKLKTAEVRALQSQDDRVGAVALYETRLAELEDE